MYVGEELCGRILLIPIHVKCKTIFNNDTVLPLPLPLPPITITVIVIN